MRIGNMGRRIVAFSLMATMMFGGTSIVNADTQATTSVDSQTVWKYLDDNTDPAGDPGAQGYTRTAWTMTDFNDSQWKSAQGTFGSKRGAGAYDSSHTADTVLEGCDGVNDYPTYYFRADFNVSNLSEYNTLEGSVEYDDGVIVYINGERVAAGHDIACDADGTATGSGFNANNQYGGSNGGPDTLEINTQDLSMLHEGENTVAVELHNGRQTSSDVWFSMPELKLAYEEAKPFEPECLTLAPGSDTTGLCVTWYAEEGTDGAQVIFGGKTIDAKVTPASTGKVSCKATIDGLTPGRSYKYQITNDKGVTLSDKYTYKCPAKGEFEFGYVGDPQINMSSWDSHNNWGGSSTQEGWQASVTAMANAGVDFIASVGDNTDTTSGKEAEYTAFFSPEELTTIPYAPTVGNHDRNDMFSYHFSYPNAVEFVGENPTGSSGQTARTEVAANYYYLYNNALFVVLNTSAYPASKEQAQVFIDTYDKVLKEATSENAGKYDWIFVQHHKSTESVAGHVADKDIQYYVEAGFEKLMDKYAVDFVMAGHDHVYARSYVLKDGKRSSVQGTDVTDPDGTVYFTANTASGLKYYALASASDKNSEYPYLADGSKGMSQYSATNLAIGVATWKQLYAPGYTIVDVNNDEVTFKSYGIDNTKKCIDSMTVTKTVNAGGNDQPSNPSADDKTVTELRSQLETANQKLTAANQKLAVAEYNCVVKSRKSKKYITLTWKKLADKNVKYQVYRSTKPNSGFKKVTTTSSGSYKAAKLAKNKKYYFKVRAVRTVSGKNYYGHWSNRIYYKRVA